MTEQDPHKPALGKVWSEDPLAGDWGPGDPHKPARSEAWTEGSYGAEGGDRSRHEQDNFHGVFRATEHFLPSVRDLNM